MIDLIRTASHMSPDGSGGKSSISIVIPEGERRAMAVALNNDISALIFTKEQAEQLIDAIRSGAKLLEWELRNK